MEAHGCQMSVLIFSEGAYHHAEEFELILWSDGRVGDVARAEETHSLFVEVEILHGELVVDDRNDDITGLAGAPL